MKKRLFGLVLVSLLVTSLLLGCGKEEVQPEEPIPEYEDAMGEVPLDAVIEGDSEIPPDAEVEEFFSNLPIQAYVADGVYLASFDTDNSMFHVNEAWNGKGILTVKDGIMTIHIVMPSKNVLNLFYGLAEDAVKDGAELISPVTEEVTYDDGTTEEVYAFDVPVPVLDEEFDVALIGKKEVWYDHKVKVSDPEPYEGDAATGSAKEDDQASVSEADQMADVTLTGGSGKATVTSPAKIKEESGKLIATVEWSSPYYDYMVVDGVKYEPVNTEGNSVFEIPIVGFDQDITVVADTTAMSKPHEVEYVLRFTKK
ncbi:MAG: hypothetical protein K6E68_09920 [Lachnospiraceae bacterium]|nr:hypothetical protein [Lachnospiraceae bacterium]